PFEGVGVKAVGGVERQPHHLFPRLTADMVGELHLARVRAEDLDVDLLPARAAALAGEGEKAGDDALPARHAHAGFEIAVAPSLVRGELARAERLAAAVEIGGHGDGGAAGGEADGAAPPVVLGPRPVGP